MPHISDELREAIWEVLNYDQPKEEADLQRMIDDGEEELLGAETHIVHKLRALREWCEATRPPSEYLPSEAIQRADECLAVAAIDLSDLLERGMVAIDYMLDSADDYSPADRRRLTVDRTLYGRALDMTPEEESS